MAITSRVICELLQGFNKTSVKELRELNNENVNKILDLEEKRYNFIKENELDQSVQPGKPSETNFNFEKLDVDEDTFTVIEKSVKQVKEDTNNSLGNIDFKKELPKNLKNARPRWKTVELLFDNDYQKSLYIIGNINKPSKHYEEYMKFLIDNTQLSREQLLKEAELMRKELKDVIDENADTFGVSIKKEWLKDSPEELSNILSGKKPHKVVMKEAAELYNSFMKETKISATRKVSQILKDIDLTKLDSTLVGFRTIMNNHGKRIEELLSIDKITEKETDEMLKLFEDLSVISTQTKILQQNVARGTASGNINIEDVLKIHKDTDYTSVKSPKIFSSEKSMEDIFMEASRTFRQKVGGIPELKELTEAQRKKILDKVLKSNDMKDIILNFKKIREEKHLKGGTLKEETVFNKALSVLLESFRTSLLSSVTTQVVNISGSLISLTTEKMENYMKFGFGGFGLTKNGMSFEELKALNNHKVYDNIKGSFGNLKNSIFNKEVLNAKKMEDMLENAQLDSYQQAENVINRAISGEMFGIEGTPVGTVVDNLGRIIRTPYQVLGVVDDVFKRSGYTAKLQQLAIKESRKLPEGTTAKELKDFQEKFVKLYTDIKVNKKKELSEEELNFALKYYKNDIHEEALNHARTLTFTNDIIVDKKSKTDINALFKGVENIRNSFAPAQFVLPFYKTPVNLLKWSFNRTPGLNLLAKNNLMKLFKGTPEERADILAKTSTGAIIYGTFASMIMDEDNEVIITGGVPWKEEGALEAAGLQPYSIKIGNKIYQYNRFDPVATPLGMIADLANFHKKMIEKSNGNVSEQYLEDIDKVGESIMLALSNNVASKTWMASVDNFMQAMKGKDTYFFKNLVTAVVPFGGLAKDFTSEEYMKEAKTVQEMLYKKYTTDMNRPTLDVFGRPKEDNRTWYGSRTKELTSITKGMYELVRLNTEILPMRNIISYKNVSIELDNDQHHEMRRLLDTKFNLKDKIERLVQSRAYKKAPDGLDVSVEGTKKQMLSNLISDVKKTTKDYYISQNKELQEKWLGEVDKVIGKAKQKQPATKLEKILEN